MHRGDTGWSEDLGSVERGLHCVRLVSELVWSCDWGCVLNVSAWDWRCYVPLGLYRCYAKVPEPMSSSKVIVADRIA